MNQDIAKPLEVLSLGGGVQSSALLLMCIDGKFEHPDVVIFSDTGSEMPTTYSTVNYLKNQCEQHKIPFHTVGSNFGKDAKVPGKWNLHEYYLEMGLLPMVGNPRCTFNFKIYPVRRKVREILEDDPRGVRGDILCRMWIGITTDERKRSEHPSDLIWAKNRFPLLEMELSRQNCVDYIAKNWSHLEIQKSGCFMCMYQTSKSWARLRRDHPEKFAIAMQMEKKAREVNGIKRGLFGTKSIAGFDSDFTLEDFGLLEENVGACDEPSGSCFL